MTFSLTDHLHLKSDEPLLTPPTTSRLRFSYSPGFAAQCVPSQVTSQTKNAFAFGWSLPNLSTYCCSPFFLFSPSSLFTPGRKQPDQAGSAFQWEVPRWNILGSGLVPPLCWQVRARRSPSTRALASVLARAAPECDQWSDVPQLLQRGIPIGAKDEVIKNFDSQQLPCFLKALR